ncbi:MAG: hypothetical protein WAQ52_09710 [Terriglobales bacterium]
MDYVTRQFIFLAKKFRKELRYARDTLKGIQQALNHQVEAINKAAEATQENNNSTQELIVKFHQPRSTESHSIFDEKKKDPREWVKLAVAIAMLFIVAAYTLLAAYQLDQMRIATQTAKDSLHVTERAYIIFGQPELDYDKKMLNVPVVNTGHIPSGEVTIVLYEGTFSNESRSHDPIPFRNLVERHRSIDALSSIAAGWPSIIAIPIPKMDAKRVKDARQMVMVVGTISYNDGFPDTPTQHWTMCASTVYQAVAKQSYLRTCNGGVLLPKFEALPDWSKFTDPQTD